MTCPLRLFLGTDITFREGVGHGYQFGAGFDVSFQIISGIGGGQGNGYSTGAGYGGGNGYGYYPYKLIQYWK